MTDFINSITRPVDDISLVIVITVLHALAPQAIFSITDNINSIN